MPTKSQLQQEVFEKQRADPEKQYVEQEEVRKKFEGKEQPKQIEGEKGTGPNNKLNKFMTSQLDKNKMANKGKE